MINAVILDIDGTLLDSNDAHAISWVEAMAAEGLSVTYERVRPLIGMGGDHILPMIAGFTEGSPDGRRISEKRRQIFQDKYLASLKPFPRVRDLLLTMRDEGLKLTVASSSGEDLIDALLEKAGVADLIEKVSSKDDAEMSKPEPDIIVAALRRARINAKSTLMLGDTPYDVRAAARAGVRTVALECGGWRPEHFAKALAVYRDPQHLLEEFHSSPFARPSDSPHPTASSTLANDVGVL